MIRVEETKSHEEFLFSTWGLQPPEATRKPWIESALPLGGPADFPRALLGPREYKKKKELEPSMQVSALPFLGLE